MVRHETDGIFYMLRAASDPLTIDDFHGPGYPVAIRAAMETFRLEPFTAAKLVSALAGLGLILAAGAVFRRTDGPRVAGLAALLLAVSPVVVAAGALAMSDMLAAALAWTALALTIPRAGRFSMFGGFAAALAVLTREIYMALLVVPFLTRPMAWPFLLGFALPSGAWCIYSWPGGGHPFAGNHLNAAFKLDGWPNWSRFPEPGDFPNLAAVVGHSPARFAAGWALTLARLPVAMLAALPVAGLLALFGLFVRHHRRLAPVWGFAAVYAAAAATVWIEPRFILPLVPIVALFTARALDFLWTRFPGGWLPVVLAVGVVAAGSAGIPGWIRAEQAPEYAAAAAWIRANGPERPVILAAKPHIAFLAGGEPVTFRAAGLHRNPDARLPPHDFFIRDGRYGALVFPAVLPDGRAVHQIHEPERLDIFRESR